jgi:pimeloyl-ACP methyl ester carboxylesterase
MTGETPSPCPDRDGWVAAPSSSACVRVGLNVPAGAVSTLYAYVHADLNPVGLDHAVTRALRAVDPFAATVVMLRPGYADFRGGQTTPVTHPRPGDAYRREDALALGEALGVLRTRLGAQRVVVIGHSGGAALTANIAALFPGLVDHAVVVSCPCNLPAWRAHQAQVWASRAWLAPYRSLSPHLVADAIPKTTTVSVVVGGRDTNTPPWLHEEFADLVRSMGAPRGSSSCRRAGMRCWQPGGVALVVALVVPGGDVDAVVGAQRFEERR